MSVQVPLFDKMGSKSSLMPANVEQRVGAGFDVKTFIANFEVLTEAAGGTKRLREMVLGLAVRGALVAQAADEESADAILARLASTKCKDDSKRETELRTGLGSPPDSPWSVPSNWRFVRLEETSAAGGLFCDGDWVESKDQDPGGTVRLTQLADVGDGVWRDRSNRYMNRQTADRLRCTYLEAGDILIARMPDPIGRACIFQGDTKPCATVVDVAVLRIRPEFFDRRFVMMAVNSRPVRDFINTLVAGTTRQRVSRSNLASVVIPVPPLAEQKRIVAKVDQLMALCDELEARQSKKRETGTRLTKSALEALTTATGPEEFAVAWKRVVENFDVLFDRAEKVGGLRSVVLELAVRGRLVPPAVEDVDALLRQIADEVRSNAKVQHFEPVVEPPHPVPPHWRWVRWGHLTLTTSSGWSPQCENRPRTDKEWGVLKVSAVSWDVFQPDENKALPPGVEPRPEFAPRRGDFLMSRANTSDLVGRSVVVEHEPDHVFLSDKIIKCVFTKLVAAKYMNFFNRTRAARNHYVSEASGTSDSMKNISRDVILTVPVPLPPLAEQLRIVEKVEQLMKVCDEFEAKLRRAEDRAAKLVEAAVQELVA